METIKQHDYEPKWSQLKKLLDENYLEKKNLWDKVRDDEKLSIYKKTVPDANVIVLRIKSMFKNMDLDVVFHMIVNFTIRKQWDKNQQNFAILKQYNDNEDLAYFEVKSPAFLSNRDFLQYRSFFCNKEHSSFVKKYGLYEKKNRYYMFCASSIETAEMAEKKGVVRGETIIGGWILEEDINNPKNLLINMIIHNDVKGVIPTWVVNMVSTKFPEIFVDEVNTNYKKYYDTFKKQVDEIQREKLERIRLQEEEEGKKIQKEDKEALKKEEAEKEKAKQEVELIKTKEVEKELRRAEAEEESKRANEEEAQRRVQEEEAQRRAQEEEALRRAQEEEAQRRAQEEEAQRRAQEEEAQRRAQEEEALRRAQEEDVLKGAQEEEAQRRAQEEKEERKTLISQQEIVQAEVSLKGEEDKILKEAEKVLLKEEVKLQEEVKLLVQQEKEFEKDLGVVADKEIEVKEIKEEKDIAVVSEIVVTEGVKIVEEKVLEETVIEDKIVEEKVVTVTEETLVLKEGEEAKTEVAVEVLAEASN